MVDRERTFTYNGGWKNIKQQDILAFVFRFSGAQINEMVRKADKVISELIKKNGKLPIKEFMEIAEYDFSHPQQKYMCNQKLIIPLYNAGLIEKEYEPTGMEVTHIKLDNSFDKLTENLKIKWDHLAYMLKKV